MELTAVLHSSFVIIEIVFVTEKKEKKKQKVEDFSKQK